MSFALQINIERDTATPLLQRLAFIALGKNVNRAAAQGVVAMLKRHFQALDASRSRNRLWHSAAMERVSFSSWS